jgi:4-hydroxybenzoyl-CoA thioesterase
MIFTTTKPIRFNHCDPAGIVFYPRYYGLLHEAQEDWLAHMGFPEHTLIAGGHGVPIVNMQTDFLGMSRFGDVVQIDVDLWKLGNSSIGMRYCLYSNEVNEYGYKLAKSSQNAELMAVSAASAQPTKPPQRQVRLKAKSVVVFSTVPSGKATRIPDNLRAAMQPYLKEEPA